MSTCSGKLVDSNTLIKSTKKLVLDKEYSCKV